MKLTIKGFIVAGLVLSSLQMLNAQTLQWAKRMGGTSYDIGQSLTNDKHGNIFSTGYFYGTSDFDPGSSTLYITSSGDADGFVQKLDSTGSLVWVKSISGLEGAAPYSIAVDPSGNVLTTGRVSGKTDFDPGADSLMILSAGLDDIFIQKLDAAGNLVWARCLGGTDNDWALSVACDSLGNVYTTGRFRGTVDFDPGPDSAKISSLGFEDVFILKLDASGNLVWVKRIGGPADEVGNSIAVDKEGAVYVAGYFRNTVDFDPGPEENLVAAAGITDGFILKMSPLGDFAWVRAIQGSASEICNAIQVDHTGNVFATGLFEGTVDFDGGVGVSTLESAGQYDVFVLKMNSQGSLLWAKGFGGIEGDEGVSLSLDAFGNVFTTGYFYRTVDFDPNQGTANLSATGTESDIFVQKLDHVGNLVWARRMGSSGEDVGRDIKAGPMGDLYTIGSFNGMADFDPGNGIVELSSAGNSDIFIQKLTDPITSVSHAVSSDPFFVFPNPASKEITIQGNIEWQSIQLTDALGKDVGLNESKTANFQLGHLAPGVYFLHIKGRNQKVVRIVKE